VAQTKRDGLQARQTARQMVETQRRAEERRRNMIRAGAIIAAVVVLIGIGVAIALNVGGKKAAPATAAPSALINKVTGMSPAVLDQIGKGKVDPLPAAQTGNAVRTADGKPLVLYIGGEFCPYCAAERWPMLVALSRFGTFSNVSQINSLEDNIPTFSFHGSTYKSDYITFQPMEIDGNAVNASNSGYVPLETLSADQQAIFSKFDSGLSFPFMDFADQATVVGSSYQPTLLEGMTHDQVADKLSDPTSDVAQAIGGTANAFTAQICKLTNNQPSNVCSSAAVKAYNGG
jgi:Domain of unknown function (DUF929)